MSQKQLAKMRMKEIGFILRGDELSSLLNNQTTISLIEEL